MQSAKYYKPWTFTGRSLHGYQISNAGLHLCSIQQISYLWYLFGTQLYHQILNLLQDLKLVSHGSSCDLKEYNQILKLKNCKLIHNAIHSVTEYCEKWYKQEGKWYLWNLWEIVDWSNGRDSESINIWNGRLQHSPWRPSRLTFIASEFEFSL